MTTGNITNLISALVSELSKLELQEQIRALNEIKIAMHEVSPFKSEPVDCVLWEPGNTVQANDYNPNKVAAPEMRLLEHSIRSDGYTQPIVTHDDGSIFVVVDGFHRNRVGKECFDIKERIHGFLPVVKIRAERSSNEDRMASTIRHNRARGKHGVDPMSDLVGYLAKKGWDDQKICKEIGMDPDEVLRFRQIGGLAELFKDVEFTQAWDMIPDINPDK